MGGYAERISSSEITFFFLLPLLMSIVQTNNAKGNIASLIPMGEGGAIFVSLH